MAYKISLAGDLGSGKSTVSKIIIDRIGAEYYSTGAIARKIAASHGMSVVELNLYMETHPEIDHEIDDGLRALSDIDRNMIIDSRMAWHFVKNTFSVYLTTDLRVSAARIYNDHRVTEQVTSVEDAMESIRTRKASEKKRYFEQYGVDCKDLRNYNLVLDTTAVTPEEVAETILTACAEWQEVGHYTGCYICPTRLRYKDTSDPDAIAAASEALDCGKDVGDVTAFEHDGDFYVASGNDIALAYSLTNAPFIPVKLVPYSGEDTSDGYVSMADSL